MKMAVKAPILIAVATKWEAEPLVRRWNLREMAGSVNGVDVVLIKTGIGPANAAEALRTHSSAAFVVSAGFAGALQPKMESGDLVLDVQGLDLEVPQAARALALEQHAPLHFGKIAHSDKVLFDPREKAALGREHRCSAVDMESKALRAAAERMGVPFLAARVILDSVDQSLPATLPKSERLPDLMAYAFSNASSLPMLIRLAGLQRRAIARLAIFLEALLPKL